MENLIVTLTSYPGRIHNVYKIINKILHNTRRPDKFVFILSLLDFPNKEKDLPQEIININDNIFEILWTDKYKVYYKKIFPVLEKYPNDIYITIDDDFDVPNDFIERIYNDYQKYNGNYPITCGDFKWGNLLYTHHSAFSLTSKKFFGPYLEELYNNVVLSYNGKSYLDILITYATILNGCQYKMGYKCLKPFLIKDNIAYSKEDSPSEYLKKSNGFMQAIQNYIFQKYNITFDFSESLNRKLSNDVIVSLTSYKDRLQYVDKVISSLTVQTMLPYKICLTLYKDDIQYIPNSLKTYIDSGIVEVITCDTDLKPHKKYYYVMKKYKHNPIITIDDDTIYPNDVIETLYNSYRKFSHCISARRTHLIKYNQNGNPDKYNTWTFGQTSITEPSHDIFATGVGGILYPPNILDIDNISIDLINQYITTDDIVLKYIELLKDIKVVWVKNNNMAGTCIQDAQKTALYDNINKTSGNDIAIKLLSVNKSIEIISVNYNTPDLLKNLLNSIQKYNSSNYPVRIIDGSDNEETINKDKEIISQYKNYEIEQLYYNIHHGPGMDYAISNSKYDYLLILDSDVEIQSDLNEIVNYMLLFNKVFTGFNEEVNINGINVNHKDISYIHPRFFLVKKDEYMKLKEKGITFIKHGAPCINTMKYIHDNHLEEQYLGILDNSLKLKYFNSNNRGTVNRFGLALTGEVKKYIPCLSSNKDHIIVSLTTWKNRIDNIPHVLQTILDGNVLPYRIVLNICKDDFPDNWKSIPEKVVSFLKEHEDIIEVNWLLNNSRTWKKFIPTLYKYPNDCTLCIDDDWEYPKDFVETFEKKHKECPNTPLSGVSSTKIYNHKLQHCGTASLDKLCWMQHTLEGITQELYDAGNTDTFYTYCYTKENNDMIFVGKQYWINMKSYNDVDSYTKKYIKSNANCLDILKTNPYNKHGIDIIHYICEPWNFEEHTKFVKPINPYAVVVPFYKQSVTGFEVDTLASIYANYNLDDIYFAVPQDLIIPTDITSKSNEQHIIRFKSEYFKNISSYCKLCTDVNFYQTFKDKGYEYMLLHQMDAITIVNNVQHFVDLGYDWYGAPCPNVYRWKEPNNIGNGGMSLRKLDKMIELTKKYGITTETEDLWFCCTHRNEMNICKQEVAYAFCQDMKLDEKNPSMALHGQPLKNGKYKDIVKKYKELLTIHEAPIMDHTAEIEELQKQLDALNTQIITKDAVIAELKVKVSSVEHQRDKLERICKDQTERLNKIPELTAQIAKLEQLNKEQEQLIIELGKMPEVVVEKVVPVYSIPEEVISTVAPTPAPVEVSVLPAKQVKSEPVVIPETSYPTRCRMNDNNTVVYTCLFDTDAELPEDLDFVSSVDYVCFTNNYKLTSCNWEIRYLPNQDELSTDKWSLYYKYHPGEVLTNYLYTIWIDPKVKITDVQSIIRNCSTINDLGLIKNPSVSNISELIDTYALPADISESLKFRFASVIYPAYYAKILVCYRDSFAHKGFLTSVWKEIEEGVAVDTIYIPYILQLLNYKKLFLINDI